MMPIIRDVDIWAESDDAIDRLAMETDYDDISDMLADGIDIDDISETFTQSSFRTGKNNLKTSSEWVTTPIDVERIPF
jgi:hypothetical protein